MICLAVSLVVKSGQEQQVKDSFAKLAAASRKEAGCRMYVAHQSLDDARKFLVYEQYDDSDALEFHRNSPHLAQYATNGLYKSVESREANLYSPLA